MVEMKILIWVAGWFVISIILLTLAIMDSGGSSALSTLFGVGAASVFLLGYVLLLTGVANGFFD
jgi:preprotein translocase subunit SecG